MQLSTLALSSLLVSTTHGFTAPLPTGKATSGSALCMTFQPPMDDGMRHRVGRIGSNVGRGIRNLILGEPIPEHMEQQHFHEQQQQAAAYHHQQQMPPPHYGPPQGYAAPPPRRPRGAGVQLIDAPPRQMHQGPPELVTCHEAPSNFGVREAMQQEQQQMHHQHQMQQMPPPHHHRGPAPHQHRAPPPQHHRGNGPPSDVIDVTPVGNNMPENVPPPQFRRPPAVVVDQGASMVGNMRNDYEARHGRPTQRRRQGLVRDDLPHYQENGPHQTPSPRGPDLTHLVREGEPHYQDRWNKVQPNIMDIGSRLENPMFVKGPGLRDY